MTSTLAMPWSFGNLTQKIYNKVRRRRLALDKVVGCIGFAGDAVDGYAQPPGTTLCGDRPSRWGWPMIVGEFGWKSALQHRFFWRKASLISIPNPKRQSLAEMSGTTTIKCKCSVVFGTSHHFLGEFSTKKCLNSTKNPAQAAALPRFACLTTWGS